MKIDKTNPLHWLYLVVFAVNVVLGMALRRLIRRSGKPLVVLYGHKLSGNLLAIYRYLRQHCMGEMDVVFLTVDPVYAHELRAQGDACALAISPTSISLLAHANAVISDHGLHALQLMLGCKGLKFFDVWHAIPFKGFDAADFRVQHRYDEIWVASRLMQQIYVERYGFDPNRLKVTGYARTDRLVAHDEDCAAIRRSLGLDGFDVGKIVLFAPTWTQDVRDRSIYPFGTDEDTFMDIMSGLATRTGSTIVMRTHLNSRNKTAALRQRIVTRPQTDYPDTEQLLLISDVLVCDWSSIAFDWLLLKRPTIFLEVDAPFAKGYSLGPEYRYGQVARSMQELVSVLECDLQQPEHYQTRCGPCAERVREDVYGGFADGKATPRCARRLAKHL